MFYNSRWYDSSLGRFAQADTIVPAGVQGYDRYAFVNNNPVRYTDQSGHMAVEQNNSKKGCSNPWYCEGGKPREKDNPYVGLPRPHASTSPLPKEDSYTSSHNYEGLIYSNHDALLNKDIRSVWLETKAEENYDGWSGSGKGGSLGKYVDLLLFAIGVLADFNNTPPVYPIGVRVKWESTSSGVIIHGVQVKNYSPSFVSIDKIRFDMIAPENGQSLPGSVVMNGPRDVVGINGNKPGIINMNVGAIVPSSYTALTVEVVSVGNMSNPYYVFDISSNNLIPGCSSK